MEQNLLEKLLFKLLKELYGVFRYPNHVGSVKKLYQTKTYLVQLNFSGLKNLLWNVVSLFIYSGKFNNFLRRKVAQNYGGWPDSKVIEDSPLFALHSRHLLPKLLVVLMNICDRVRVETVLTEDAILSLWKVQFTQMLSWLFPDYFRNVNSLHL